MGNICSTTSHHDSLVLKGSAPQKDPKGNNNVALILTNISAKESNISKSTIDSSIEIDSKISDESIISKKSKKSSKWSFTSLFDCTKRDKSKTSVIFIKNNNMKSTITEMTQWVDLSL
jgi:hypothetical protein